MFHQDNYGKGPDYTSGVMPSPVLVGILCGLCYPYLQSYPYWATKLDVAFEKLEHTKPDVTHFCVFGCGAYIFLPEEVHTNKLNPKSELMTFIGYPQGTKGWMFMRGPNNVIFTAAQALFDKTLFPKCPDMHWPGSTPVADLPVGHQGDYNIFLDDENEEFGGDGNGHNLPPIPQI